MLCALLHTDIIRVKLLGSWFLFVQLKSWGLAPSCGGFPTNMPPPSLSLTHTHAHTLPLHQSCAAAAAAAAAASSQRWRAGRSAAAAAALSSSLRWMLDVPWGLRGSGQLCASSSPPPAGSARPLDTVRRIKHRRRRTHFPFHELTASRRQRRA